MRFTNINKLQCPACREAYEAQVISADADRVETAFLTCPRCCITIPVLKGFPLFEEQFLADRLDAGALADRFFGASAGYRLFLEKKREKPVYDLYAAFQPFNESTQSLFPLLPLLRERLHPGDLILDMW
jgi:hypothetical protein